MSIQEKAKAWFGEYKIWDDEPEPRWKTDVYLDIFEAGDKAALMQLAADGNICAICALLVGMKRKERSWMEDFVDEETGKHVSFMRSELINGVTFNLSDHEKAFLLQKLDEIKVSVDDYILCHAAWHLRSEADLDATTLYIELVDRGIEDAAEYIEDPAFLQELCDKGNKWAAYALYGKYCCGDEEHGIFINKERAKEYYDLAGDIPSKEEWDSTDEAGEEYPTTRKFTLTGDAATLDGVETLIRDLAKRFGIPENEKDGLGLFVPQRQLMKVLVGSDSVYYRGNVQHLDREAPDRLVITTEADEGAPLLYALRQCFENLNIEMKKAE